MIRESQLCQGPQAETDPTRSIGILAGSSGLMVQVRRKEQRSSLQLHDKRRHPLGERLQQLGGRRRYRLAAMTAAAARDGKNCKLKEVPHGVSPGRGPAERR